MDLPDIADLLNQLDAVERDAQTLICGLTEERSGWREKAGSWSVAECLDHLATTNRVYLQAMHPSAARASAESRVRRGPAMPGFLGGWFARSMEPPVKSRKMKAPAKIAPRAAPPLADASEDFLASHHNVRDFLHTNAGLDLAGVRFPNPFLPGVRFSLATGLHVIVAHERRHLWQAWRVRRSREGLTL